jgi:hypothetical protein
MFESSGGDEPSISVSIVVTGYKYNSKAKFILNMP